MFRLLTCLLSLGLALTARAQEVVRVDLEQRFQAIDHFGASDAWTTQLLNEWSAQSREKIADLLFDREKGIGLSQWRFAISAGHQPDRVEDPRRSADSFEVAPGKYDWSRHPAQRWMLAAAKARGVDNFLAFSYSGTPRMTPNGKVNPDPGPLSINLRPDAVQDYATYLADVVEYFARSAPADERVTFRWLSPINEPQWKWDRANQEATRASNADLKRVYAAVGAELRRRRLPTRVHGVESGCIPDLYGPHKEMTASYGTLFGDYIRDFCGDPAMGPLLGNVLSYHSYWSDGPDKITADRERLREAMARYPGWQFWQSEYCRMEWKRDLGMDMALNVAAVIHADLAVAGASAWDWWLALSTGDYKDGLLYTDWARKGNPEVVIVPKTFWAFGHYSRFVRPGMVRVACAAPEPLLASAFAAPGEQGKAVVVLINPSHAAHTVTLDFGKKSMKRHAAYLTDGEPGHELHALAPTAAGAPIAVPARAVVTVVCE